MCVRGFFSHTWNSRCRNDSNLRFWKDRKDRMPSLFWLIPQEQQNSEKYSFEKKFREKILFSQSRNRTKRNENPRNPTKEPYLDKAESLPKKKKFVTPRCIRHIYEKLIECREFRRILMNAPLNLQQLDGFIFPSCVQRRNAWVQTFFFSSPN